MQKYLMNNILFDTLEEAQNFYIFKKIKVGSLFIVRNGIQEYRFEKENQANTFLQDKNNQVEIYDITPIEVLEPQRDLENLLKNNLKFGENLIKTFLLDNYNLPQSFTAEQSAILMRKFEVIIKLCQLGDIRSVLQLLPTIEVDNIFTQERKDKYIEIINNYLNG